MGTILNCGGKTPVSFTTFPFQKGFCLSLKLMISRYTWGKFFNPKQNEKNVSKLPALFHVSVQVLFCFLLPNTSINHVTIIRLSLIHHDNVFMGGKAGEKKKTSDKKAGNTVALGKEKKQMSGKAHK